MGKTLFRIRIREKSPNFCCLLSFMLRMALQTFKSISRFPILCSNSIDTSNAPLHTYICWIMSIALATELLLPLIVRIRSESPFLSDMDTLAPVALATVFNFAPPTPITRPIWLSGTVVVWDSIKTKRMLSRPIHTIRHQITAPVLSLLSVLSRSVVRFA